MRADNDFTVSKAENKKMTGSVQILNNSSKYVFREH